MTIMEVSDSGLPVKVDDRNKIIGRGWFLMIYIVGLMWI